MNLPWVCSGDDKVVLGWVWEASVYLLKGEAKS